jgi:hypothetical protein
MRRRLTRPKYDKSFFAPFLVASAILAPERNLQQYVSPPPINNIRRKLVNKQIVTLAAVATLILGGVAFAQNAPTPSAGSDNTNAMSNDKGATGNGGMAGEPDSAKTPKVEGKSGSQSGAHPADKMAPDQK